MNTNLTEQEAKIAQMLGEVWNEYLSLPVEHPMDQQEFCRAIHTCQDMVLARCGRRALNAALKPLHGQ
jgi:hypothetical protein